MSEVLLAAMFAQRAAFEAACAEGITTLSFADLDLKALMACCEDHWKAPQASPLPQAMALLERLGYTETSTAHYLPGASDLSRIWSERLLLKRIIAREAFTPREQLVERAMDAARKLLRCRKVEAEYRDLIARAVNLLLDGMNEPGGRAA